MQLKEAQGAMQRVFEILDAQPEIADQPRHSLSIVEGHVRVEGIGFGYDPQHPVLSNLSFEAKAGELVALVGPTGAGKTTVINLLHRFYDPTEGRITIDGKDLRHVTVESWYRQVALVPQETILFGVNHPLDNIRYGNMAANEAKILEASKAAHARRLHHELAGRVSNPGRREGSQPLRWTTPTNRDRSGNLEESAHFVTG